VEWCTELDPERRGSGIVRMIRVIRVRVVSGLGSRGIKA
jgi:hypothetical protein